jgi:tape measure domain-containing protein
MADYDAKIRVSADTKQAESQLKQLQDKLNNLSRAAGNINTGSVEAGIRRVGNVAQNVGTEVRNIFSRGLFAGAVLGAGQLGTSISSAASNLGPFTGAVKAAGAAFSSSLGGVPSLIGDILNQIGQVPNAMGLAAVAAMAFAPQILKASSAAVGLGAAIDTAVGKQATQAIANAVSKVTGLKTELNATQTAFKDLIKGSTLNQLNKQLQDATYQAGEYHSTTVDAVTAANQLAVVLKAQRAEQQAITDLARQAQGLRAQSVENRATNTYNTTQRRKAYESEQLNKFNNEIDEYNRLAVEAAANTKAWEDKLTAITRVAGAGPLGTKSQLSTRVQEFLANKQSAQIARENSAAKLEAERVTSRTFELFPGGQYSTAKQRNDLNEIATIQNSVTEAVARTGRSQRQLEIASIGTAKSSAQRLQISTVQNKVDAQSIAIARARNLELAKELGIEVNIGKAAANKNKARGGGLGKGAAGALSNAAVGGAFPLLFGQSGAAAAGGALGGALGSVIPGIGGFGGSLIGTILGEKLGQGNQVKQLGEDIGFSAEQTKMLGVAFQQAGRDFDKFQQSVSTIQGLSLSIEDQAKAIQLASSLTETYKGKIDKVTNAFAGALSTGKVTQGTLNQLTNNGIPIQQALADKYNVSRSAIIQMAKDGKISVQDLIDTLVKVGNEGAKAAGTQKDVFADSFEQISKAVANFQTTASKAFKETGDALRVDLGGAVQAVTTYITDLIGGFGELARVAGPVLDPIISGYINLEKAIFNAVGAVPALKDAIVSFVLTTLGPLQGVVTLMNQIRGLGAAAKGPEKMGPYVPDRLKQKPSESFIAPSQAVPSDKGSSEADKAAKAAEREAARVANIVRDRAVATEQLRLQMQYSHGLLTAEVAKDEVLKIQLQHAQKYGQISLEYSKQINDEVAKGNSVAAKEAITKEYLLKLEAAQLDETMDLKLEEIKRAENYANIIADLDYELQLKTAVTEQDRIQLQLAYEAAKLKKDNPQFSQEQIDAITQKKTSLAAPKTDRQTIEGRVGQLQDEIKEMTKLSTIAITSADGIGTAFGNSFKSLIDGSMTAREALSSFFKDVASMFLDMAAQIIAKQMTMIILQTILKALGAVAGASGGGGFGAGGNSFNANGALPAGTGNIPSLGSSYGFAKGGAFANGITAFASGGIVGSPTLFKFANGGTTQTGLMGEAGPEAIMPLSRGAGGKLGVNASGLREAMGGAPGMGGSPVLSMSFETTRFGDTDYVSRDQLEAAMAQTRKQASADGAKRGMSMTLDRLQQSPQTRSRVGLR